MINLSMVDPEHNLRPRLTVIGVGGAGGNAINNMIRCQLEGCDFIAANTDSQALAMSLAGRKIQLGINLSRGLGAGSKSDIGRAAAEEQLGDIMAALEGSDMLFVTAGMGGGTGTGAAPVIARVAREAGILTVGVVTKPFHFEGNSRMRQAEAGLNELQQYVDTLIVIPNQNLFRIANERTTFAEAFRLADEVLHCGVRGITDLMVMPGFMNLDFADVKTVMGEMGKAMMGTGEAEGENRAVRAAEAAISNPLLDDVSMKGARGVLINITGGLDMTLFEVDQAANRIREEVDPEAQIKVGSTLGENMDGSIRVSVIATGIDAATSTRTSASSGSGTSHIRPTPKQTAPQAQTPSPVSPPVQAAPQSASHPTASSSWMRPVSAPPTGAPVSYFSMPQGMATQPVVSSPAKIDSPIDQKGLESVSPPVSASERSDTETPTATPQSTESPSSGAGWGATESWRKPAETSSYVGPQASASQNAPSQTPPSTTPRTTRPASPPLAAQGAEMRMTQLMPQAQPAQTQPPQTGSEQRRQRRAESLFTRITGFGMVRPSAQHHEDDTTEMHPTDELVTEHTGQGGTNPSTLSIDQTEEALDIPAFLRRQNNH